MCTPYCRRACWLGIHQFRLSKMILGRAQTATWLALIFISATLVKAITSIPDDAAPDGILNVWIVSHSHDDVGRAVDFCTQSPKWLTCAGWLKTVDEYYD